MVILVTGADGLIGSALIVALRGRGHTVLAAMRSPEAASDGPAMAADFRHDVDVPTWRARLVGVDAVVNTVGILRERGSQTFARVHVDAPKALFAACAAMRIARVVQLSALGADAAAASGYHRSKREADDALLAQIPSAWCAQPSLVYGRDGASTRLFNALASLPLVPLPGRGTQCIQPIHLDDVVAALCALIEAPPAVGGRVALVGPRPLTVRAYLLALREGMGIAPTVLLPMPRALMHLAARVGDVIPGLLLDRATLGMLERGNVGDAGAVTGLLGRAPRPPAQFIEPADAAALRTGARLTWLLPLARASVALVWIVTGIVSLGAYPVEDSYALLARVGVAPPYRPSMLYGAALTDVIFGLLVFALAGEPRRWLWRAQAALIVLYSALIAWRLPEFWIHPYGPLIKNVPLLALLILLDVLEPRRRRAP